MSLYTSRLVTLEPLFLAFDVGLVEFLIRFSQIDDTLDESDNANEPASNEAENQLDDRGFGIPQNELVDSKSTKENAHQTTKQLLLFGFLVHTFSPFMENIKVLDS